MLHVSSNKTASSLGPEITRTIQICIHKHVRSAVYRTPVEMLYVRPTRASVTEGDDSDANKTLYAEFSITCHLKDAGINV